MNETPTYYAIIPADVRYCKDLTPSQKLLYSEITVLTLSTGECWAGNEYFASLYGVSKRAISCWISGLVHHGFIERHVTYKKGTKEIKKRILTVTATLRKETSPPSGRNVPYPREEIGADNSTSINKDICPTSRTELYSEEEEAKNRRQTEKMRVRKTYRPLTKSLLAIIETQRKVVKGVRQVSWDASFKRLCEIDGIPVQTIRATLTAYGKIIGREYVPEAHSAQSFRKKYAAILSAIDREGVKTTRERKKQNRGEDMKVGFHQLNPDIDDMRGPKQI